MTMTGHRPDSYLSLIYIEIGLGPTRADHKLLTQAYKENANADVKYRPMWYQQQYGVSGYISIYI